MPQDKTIDAAGKEINPAILSTKVENAKKEGSIMPFDKVKVYATDVLVKSNSISEVTKAGQEMEVHPSLADKLVASGKATKTAPADKK